MEGDGGTGAAGSEQQHAATDDAVADSADSAAVVPSSDISVSETVAPEGGELPVRALREDADLCEYAKTLGIDSAQDEDLLWVAQQAFNARLPGSWVEFADETGRVYYFHEASNKTTWEHPMDEVFRELLAIVRQTRIVAGASEAQRLAAIREHLQQVHARALEELKVWSGPYASDQGEYYYNDELKASAWESPVTALQDELAVRHDVLTRCLLHDPAAAAAALVGGPVPNAGVGLLEQLRLPLGLVRRESTPGEVPLTPSTSRTFYTARSACSSRSKHSVVSDRSKRSGHKKEHREHRSSRSRSDRAQEPVPAPAAPAHAPDQRQPSVFQAVD